MIGFHRQIGARRGNQRSSRKLEPRSANARHECFFINASVSAKTAETAEMDDIRASRPSDARRPLPPRKAIVIRPCAPVLDVVRSERLERGSADARIHAKGSYFAGTCSLTTPVGRVAAQTYRRRPAAP